MPQSSPSITDCVWGQLCGGHAPADVPEKMDTPGTQLHAAWSGLPAPSIAIGYWRLPATASFLLPD